MSRGKALVLPILLGAVALSGSSAPTRASEPELLLSTDGETWAPALDRPLFDEAGPVVPGGTVEDALHLFNGGTGGLLVSLYADDIRASTAAFADALVLSATSAAGRTQVLSLSGDAECSPLVRDELVLPGQGATVRLAIGMDVDADSLARQDVGFGLRAVVRAAGAPAPEDDCPSGVPVPVFEPREPELGGTGADVGLAVLAATALLGLGALLVRGRRTEREE